MVVNPLWRWLADEGIITSKCPVKPRTVREGLSLVAQKDIARNEVVLEVPKKFWINSYTVSGLEIGGVCGGMKHWIAVMVLALMCAMASLSDNLNSPSPSPSAHLQVLNVNRFQKLTQGNAEVRRGAL